MQVFKVLRFIPQIVVLISSLKDYNSHC